PDQPEPAYRRDPPHGFTTTRPGAAGAGRSVPPVRTSTRDSTPSAPLPAFKPLSMIKTIAPEPVVPVGRVNRARARPDSTDFSAPAGCPSRVNSEPGARSATSTRVGS